MRLLFVSMLLIGLSCVARGSLLLTIDSPIFFGLPGDDVPITGTLSNPDPDPIYLNNFSGILTSPDLSFDLTDFFTVVPNVLNNGDSYSGPIVAVLIDPLGQSGDFFGSITLQGGIDVNAFDDLATQNFQFTILSSVPAEPSSLALFGIGVVPLFLAHLWYKKQRA